jgi:uncharacterized protein (TIGR02599 family)
MYSPVAQTNHNKAGFTLVELMVAMSVFVLLAFIVFSITNETNRLFQSTTGKIESFQAARAGFESMTRRISQATLNTYWDYVNAAGQPRPEFPPPNDPQYAAKLTAYNNFQPSRYSRYSELHFIIGQASRLITANQSWSGDPSPVRPTHAIFFQAPLGFVDQPETKSLDKLLNACGYYVEFNSDKPDMPPFIATSPSKNFRYRYRLMEFTQPSKDFSVYEFPAAQGSPNYNKWFNIPLTGSPAQPAPTRPLAENVVALVIWPKRSPQDDATANNVLAPNYEYDSRTSSSTTPQNLHRHQLPPMVQVTMIAIDEPSAVRLALQNGSDAPKLVEDRHFADVKNYSSGDLSSPQDLEEVQQTLIASGVKYRVFTTNVSIRGSKWSEN